MYTAKHSTLLERYCVGMGKIMIVLLDLEWIDDGEKHLTQLSALRVDDEWEPIDRLDILVNPGAAFCANDKHIAFGGIAMGI